MTRPNDEGHRQHHDGYKRECNFGYSLGVDGITVECRCFNGHFSSAQNDAVDIKIKYNSIHHLTYL